MQDNGSAATVMLGLTGFVLLSVSQRDDEFEQAVETLEVEAACRSCGCRPGCMTGDRPGCGTCPPAVGR